MCPDVFILRLLAPLHVHRIEIPYRAFPERIGGLLERDDRGSSIEDRGSRIEDRGSRIEDRGSKIKDRGWRMEGRGSRIGDRGSNWLKKLENKINK